MSHKNLQTLTNNFGQFSLRRKIRNGDESKRKYLQHIKDQLNWIGFKVGNQCVEELQNSCAQQFYRLPQSLHLKCMVGILIENVALRKA